MKPRIGAVLQARLGSTRLKQKALRLLNGQPLILQVSNQVRSCKQIDEVILMTSNESLDLNLIELFQDQKMGFATGPVDDIVTRLHTAADKYHFDYLVRIWGDCPFVCPDIITEMLEVVLTQKLDFISNSDIQKRTFPPGLDVEIYSKDLLNQMNQQITDPKKREFPIEYVRNSIASEKQDRYHDKTGLLNASDLHMTIDYEEDLSAAETIYQILQKNNSAFTYPQLRQLIEQQPELFKKFSAQTRNAEYKNYINQNTTPTDQKKDSL